MGVARLVDSTPMPDIHTSPSLGQRILRLREARRLSLRTLAERVGLSASFLSQVERDEASPSIASLDKIAQALDVELATLFQHSPSDPLVRREERSTLKSAWSRATLESLSRVSGKLQPRLLTLRPGGGTGFFATSDAETFLLVLKGSLAARLGEGELCLKEGDALHALREHRFLELKNTADDDTALLIVTLGGL